MRGQILADIGSHECLDDGRVEFVDDGARCFSGRVYAVPGTKLIALDASFLQGRQIRCEYCCFIARGLASQSFYGVKNRMMTRVQ